MTNKFGSHETRLSRLERVCGLQQQIIDRLSTAVFAHQKTIEALAVHAGVEFETQPAQHTAPLSTMN